MITPPNQFYLHIYMYPESSLYKKQKKDTNQLYSLHHSKKPTSSLMLKSKLHPLVETCQYSTAQK